MQAEDYRKVPEVGVTNPTIDVLRAHRTIRKFEDSPLSAQERDALIDVARRAPHVIIPSAVLDHSCDRCRLARSAC